MRVIILAFMLLTLALSFQNCGDSARVNGDFFSQDVMNQESSGSFCSGTECESDPSLLWMQIREYEPYEVEAAFLFDPGHFQVSGRCGVGTFFSHTFIWRLSEGFGSQREVGAGESEPVCRAGQFSFPVAMNLVTSGLNANDIVDRRYVVTVELVGIDHDNQRYTNASPVNDGSVEVIFVQD